MTGREQQQSNNRTTRITLMPSAFCALISLEIEAVSGGWLLRSQTIPTLASNSKLHFGNGLQTPKMADARELMKRRFILCRRKLGGTFHVEDRETRSRKLL